MIARFEKALAQLLIKELQYTHESQDLQLTLDDKHFIFEPPTRKKIDEWPKPTINLFLHDIRENHRLRGQQPGWNSQRNGNQAIMRRQAVNFDLHYMITIWPAETERNTEHDILFALLGALLRNDGLPDDLRRQYLPEVAEGVSFKVAQYDTHINPRDIWSVLDNEMRVAIDLVATVTFNPFHYEPSVPLVREVGTVFHEVN
jgi:hypothetical protein